MPRDQVRLAAMPRGGDPSEQVVRDSLRALQDKANQGSSYLESFTQLSWVGAGIALPQTILAVYAEARRMVGAGFICGATGITANVANYRQFSLYRCRAGVISTSVATADTSASTFSPFVEAGMTPGPDVEFQEGDGLVVEMAQVGVGPAVGNMALVVRWEII